jgi:hypothetical protein
VPLKVPVVAWAITGALEKKTIAINESVNVVNTANDLAKCELLILPPKI